MNNKPPYVQIFKDRHGKTRCYYRRSGHRQPIDGEPGSSFWYGNYARIHASFEDRGDVVPDHETFRAAVQEYYSSARYRKLRTSTQANYRSSLDELVEILGMHRLSEFTRGSVIKIRDMLAQRSKSRAMLAIYVLRSVFDTACDNDIIDRNPAKGVTPPEGFEPKPHRKWDDVEIEAFKKRAKPHVRRAMMVLLYTGLRVTDATNLKRDAIKQGVVRLRTQKTDTPVVIPVHSELKVELERNLPVESIWLISGAYGQQMNRNSMHTMLKREFKRLGIDDAPTTHGLRKNAVVCLIEAGAEPRQIQAITGQSLAMIEHYGREYSRDHLAHQAIRLWEDKQ